jgi:hypothetical protein
MGLANKAAFTSTLKSCGSGSFGGVPFVHDFSPMTTGTNKGPQLLKSLQFMTSVDVL